MAGAFDGMCGVVTGGSSGIGRASALRLARDGASVAIGSTDGAAGQVVVSEIEALGGKAIHVETDVTDPGQVERLIDAAEAAVGRVRFLFACAGVGSSGTAETTSVDEWRRVINVNLTGSFLLAKFGIPALFRAGGGAILLTGSDLGQVGATNSVAYCASKGGVTNLTRALALDCAPLGIRVNCIAPGSTRTPMLDRWFDGSPDPDAELAGLAERIPLGRPADPGEIAELAAVLLSDASSYMTGAVIPVDGGVTAWYGL
ncbi:MAG: SDR family NAD(P)-dependent oxidoreductase [Actinomycetota bacterium]